MGDGMPNGVHRNGAVIPERCLDVDRINMIVSTLDEDCFEIHVVSHIH